MLRVLGASFFFAMVSVMLIGTSVSADLADNIILYSPLDDIDTPPEYFWEDVSGNGYHVNNVMPAAYNDGASHTSAVECVGSETTRMTVENGIYPDLDAAVYDFSVSCWAYQDSASIAWIMDKGAWSTGKQSGWAFMSINGDPTFRVMGVGDDGSNQITLTTDSSVDLTDGWHMMTGVLDRSGTVSGTVDNMLFYVDGQLVASQVLPYVNGAPMVVSNFDSQLMMGGRPAITYNFDGYLDDVGIYSTALSATDVQTLYNTATLTTGTLPSATPVALYNFESTYGGELPPVPDLIGGNDALLYGGMPASDPNRGDVLDFNGSSTALANYGDILEVADGSRTVSLWFKADAPSGIQYIVADGNSGISTDPGWSVFLSDGDLFVRANMTTPGAAEDNRVATYYDEGASDGLWHHLAFTIDNENGILAAYLDGQGSGADGQENGWAVGRGGATTVLFPAESACGNADFIALGANSDAAFGFEGMVDDFAMWDRVLTEAEILSIYNGTPIPTEATPNHIAGDANDDGKVDGSDVTILAGNWQAGVGAPDPSTVTWEMGDFNGDGQVDGSDVTILAGNWQYGVTAEAASVPEPNMIVMLLMVLGSWFAWKRR